MKWNLAKSPLRSDEKLIDSRKYFKYIVIMYNDSRNLKGLPLREDL